MFNQKPDQAYFEIHLSEIEDDTISVLSFEGNEEISELFNYRIKFVSKDAALDSSKILNKPATFTFIRGEEKPEKIYGIVSRFEQLNRTGEFALYNIELVPRLWRLNLVYQNEVYQNMKINEIIENVLSDAGIKGSSFKIDTQSQYPTQEFVVQYRETNFNFLNRRLEHFGIFYYFDFSSGQDTVVFIDSNTKILSIKYSEDIKFNENKNSMGDDELIYLMTCMEKVVTGAVQLKDYNYLFPENQLIGESQLDSKMPGIYYDFGDNFENQRDAETLAKIRNQEFISQSKIFKGISDSRVLRAGYKFKLNSHFRDEWNQEYILTKVHIKGSQPGLFRYITSETERNITYECEFTAIPFNIDYRPLRKTPVPKITGIMSAKLESGTSDEYAFIDDFGRYKAKMFFDISEITNGEASLPIRLSQSYSGAGYGIHFPIMPDQNYYGLVLMEMLTDQLD